MGYRSFRERLFQLFNTNDLSTRSLLAPRPSESDSLGNGVGRDESPTQPSSHSGSDQYQPKFQNRTEMIYCVNGAELMMLRDGGDSSEKSMLTGLGGICATAVAASFTSTQSAAVDAVFIAVSILTFILVIYFWARARKTRLLRDKIITRISAQGDNVSPLGNDDGHV